MKKTILLLWMISMLCTFACAEEDIQLPKAVLNLCAQAHPGYSVAAHDGWGDEARGQFALILKQGDDNILCMAEKGQDDAAYQLTIDNTNAVYDGDQLPSLLIDSGGDSLFYSYHDEVGDSVHVHTIKQDGKWLEMDVTRYANLNDGYRCICSGVRNGHLYYSEDTEDENGNILRGFDYAPIPVDKAFEAAMEPQNFDINQYDPDPIYGLFYICRLPGLAQMWLRNGEKLISIDLKQEHVIMLLEAADGTKRLCIASLEDGLYRISSSGPLPEDVGMDAFHAGEDELILTRAGGMTLIGFAYRPDGYWRMDYIQGKEGMTILQGGIRSMEIMGVKRNDEVVYGDHPWNDLFNVDFDALPHTFSQAADMIDQSAYALVHNPNSADRLHLRVKPDKGASSLGKFYNRTPVYILEQSKTWTKVRIGSEERGLTGYMMTKFLVFEEDEKAVLACAFPQKHFREELKERRTPLLLRADSSSEENGWFTHDYGDFIIGVVGDEWYVVMRADGAVGYVPQDLFWDGNG